MLSEGFRRFTIIHFEMERSKSNGDTQISSDDHHNDDAISVTSLEDINDIQDTPIKFSPIHRRSSSDFSNSPCKSSKVISGHNLTKSISVQFDKDLDEDHEDLHKHLNSDSLKTKIFRTFKLENLVNVRSIEENYSKDCFKDIKYICDGSHSNLYKAILMPESRTVILKVLLDKSTQNEIANEEYKKEILFLSKINHPNIIQLFGSGFIDSKMFKGMKRSMIVLEALDGDTLTYHLSLPRSFHSRPFTESRYLRMAREFACALKYIHDEIDPECTLIHRDLKPDNIGFLKDGTLKLLDFGLATSLRKGCDDINGTYKLTGCTGSLRYMAPEVALNKPYNEKVDIYGYGMIMYHIVTGVKPFAGYTKEKIYDSVIHSADRPALDFDEYHREIKLSGIMKNLISQCWDDKSTNRPSAGKLYELIESLESECNKAKLK